MAALRTAHLAVVVCSALLSIATVLSDTNNRYKRSDPTADSSTEEDIPGNWCYSCHVTPHRNNCQASPNELLEAKRHVLDILEKNGTIQDASLVDNVALCKSPIEGSCVIEEVLDATQTKLYYRDCSDGKNFAVNLTNSRLANLQPDNVTHCSMISDTQMSAQICVRLCTGDFCNGPMGSLGVTPTSGMHVLLLAISVPIWNWLIHCGVHSV